MNAQNGVRHACVHNCGARMKLQWLVACASQKSTSMEYLCRHMVLLYVIWHDNLYYNFTDRHAHYNCPAPPHYHLAALQHYIYGVYPFHCNTHATKK